MLPLDKISLTIVLKKVVYFADYKHITLPATQRNHLDPILCYHRPHASHKEDFGNEVLLSVYIQPLSIFWQSLSRGMLFFICGKFVGES